MTPAQQQALFENTARAMGDAWQHIKERHIANCLRADEGYGAGVARPRPRGAGARQIAHASDSETVEFLNGPPNCKPPHPKRWPAMKTNTDPKPVLGRKKTVATGRQPVELGKRRRGSRIRPFRVQLRHRTRRVCLAERRRQSSNFYVPTSQLPYSHCNVAGVNSTASCTPTAYGLLIDRFGLRRLRFRTRRPAPRDPGRATRARAAASAQSSVPELQRRNFFRREYEGRTLREHLGLPRPANRLFQKRGL